MLCKTKQNKPKKVNLQYHILKPSLPCYFKLALRVVKSKSMNLHIFSGASSYDCAGL